MSADKSQDEALEREFMVLTLYIRGKISEGQTNDQIISDLVDKGMTHEQAQTCVEITRERHDAFQKKQHKRIVEEGQLSRILENSAKRDALARKGWKRMWIGLLALIIGSFVTWSTYSSAASSPYGGSYTICYGAIIFGAIYFLWGLSEWSSNR